MLNIDDVITRKLSNFFSTVLKKYFQNQLILPFRNSIWEKHILREGKRRGFTHSKSHSKNMCWEKLDLSPYTVY